MIAATQTKMRSSFRFCNVDYFALAALGAEISEIKDVSEFSHFTSNGGCRHEEKSHKHRSLFTKLVISHWKSFYSLDQIKSNCMYWLHWKAEKNRTEPNELDELKYSKWFNQTTSYAHWHACICMLTSKIFLFISYIIRRKDWAKLLKITQLDNQPYSLTGLYLHAPIKAFMYASH